MNMGPKYYHCKHTYEYMGTSQGYFEISYVYQCLNCLETIHTDDFKGGEVILPGNMCPEEWLWNKQTKKWENTLTLETTKDSLFKVLKNSYGVIALSFTKDDGSVDVEFEINHWPMEGLVDFMKKSSFEDYKYVHYNFKGYVGINPVLQFKYRKN